ncbi:ketopantoate reductase family protein [Kitasatospora fiedleri]|uniref:ketopantoate reductase family protein n=1 Tax=Kitasatospora fiedleri TaxID=2991545 RepID=UPI00249A827A|nr:2-dehydropantoate 2-reductase [Kitasatospora fiedleri]
MSTSKPTVAVLGPGGVGGLLAALLARAGHRVVCLAGDRTAAVLRADGLHVDSEQYGEFTAAVAADTVLREPVDALFVTVKQTSLAEALDRVPADLLGSAVVVPLLNGVDHLVVLRARFPAAEVVAGTIQIEATRTAPGRIAHTSPFANLVLADPDQRLEPFAQALRAAGLGVALGPDESTVLWNKLSFLAPFALLTTRHRTDVGTVRDRHRPELLTVLDEVAAVARAAGAPADAEDLLALFDRFPATMRSSMQRDAEAGRPLELDAIGGAVLRAGAAHRVPTPATAQLVAALS